MSHLGTQEASDISTSTPKPKDEGKRDQGTSLAAAIAGTVVNLLNCQLAAQVAAPESHAVMTACFGNLHKLVLQQEAVFASLGLAKEVGIVRQLAARVLASNQERVLDKSTETDESLLARGTNQQSPESNHELDQPVREEQQASRSPSDVASAIVPGSCSESPVAVPPKGVQLLKRIPPHVMDKLKRRITPKAPLAFERRRKRIPLGQLTESRRLIATIVSPSRQSVLPFLRNLERCPDVLGAATDDETSEDEQDGRPAAPQPAEPFKDDRNWLKRNPTPYATRAVSTRSQRTQRAPIQPSGSSSDRACKRRKLWPQDGDFL